MDVGLTHDQLLCMVGTDHGLASASVRSVFTLATDAVEGALVRARALLGATGVVLLSTCNRTELWASFDGVPAPERHMGEDGAPGADDPLLRALCEVHGVDAADYARYFACREGDAAVVHLFQVACGLRSAIVAEDQVVSQVKQAIATARAAGAADSCLEVLFRQAVTSAKQVKSGVRFTRAYATAVEQAVDALADAGVELSQARCLVIGNGEYGRLAASTLEQRGAQVLVTVRQYTHGTVSIPQGCTGVPYADRYAQAAQCDVVMSATSSPHFTLEAAELSRALEDAGRADGARALHVFDLAIPRDVDSAVGAIAGCTLRDIDSFGTQIGQENRQAIEAAQKLLASGMGEFWDWVRRRREASQVHAPTGAFFPLFVNLEDKRAVFVGGGAVALRRIRTLLPFVSDIVVYAPAFSPELERFAADGAIQLVAQAWDPSQIEGADIVFACTNDAQVNDAVWAECKQRGILVNVASDRFKCDFHFPGVVQRDNVVIGVNAGGKDHRRVKQLRARIDKLMDEEDV